MTPSTHRALWWLAGPTVGILVVAWVAWLGTGPGLAFWAVFSGLIFLVGTPLMQFALLRTPKLRGQHAAVGVVALSAIACCAAIAWTSGAFAFW
jgi:predicted permease